MSYFLNDVRQRRGHQSLRAVQFQKCQALHGLDWVDRRELERVDVHQVRHAGERVCEAVAGVAQEDVLLPEALDEPVADFVDMWL